VRPMTILGILCAILATLSPAAAADPFPPDDEALRLPVAMLMDVGLRGDFEGIALARTRLSTLLAAPETGSDRSRLARIHYFLALADWLASQARGYERNRSIAMARQALTELDRTIELDPELAAAYALINRSIYMLGINGVRDPDLRTRALESYRKAVELDPTDPVVLLVDGAMTTFTPPEAGGGWEQGIALVDRAILRLARDADSGDPYARGWLAMAYAWRGMAYLNTGDVTAARHTFEMALDARPDYWTVQVSLLPMTERVEPGAVPDVAPERWTLLAEDPAGDGRRPDLPDLERLSWFREEPSGRLWFRFELARPADPKRFGVNLPFDVDDDQSTGMAWWGGNTEFTFDRLVTVWVARESDGSYRGTAGMADAEGVAEGRMLNLGQGNVAFAIDPDGAIVVGFQPDELGLGQRSRLLGVVGSNVDWNDVVEDEGSCVLDLSAGGAGGDGQREAIGEPGGTP